MADRARSGAGSGRGGRLRGALPAVLAALALSCSPGPSPAGGAAVDSSGGGQDEAEARRLEEEYARLVERYNRQTGALQIRVEELRRALDRGEDLVLLDVREPEEHAVSTIPGARLVPPAAVDAVALDLSADATVVTFCTAGYRSGQAAVALSERLGRPVRNLSGGIILWFNRGGEVVGPDSESIDRIHPYGDEWARYVRPRE